MNLGGCASSNSKEQIFGDQLPSIKQVYQQKLGQVPERQQPRRVIQDKDSDLNGNPGYRELRQQFPLLPNPVMLLYIYPHLTAAGTPVPGYYTLFPFYRQNHYAAPGEVVEPVTSTDSKTDK